VFKGFHRFLEVRKAVEIEVAFGVRLACPVDEYNSSRHVSSDSPAQDPPPTPERIVEFFGFLRARIGTARKYGPAARDYALFRTLYHAGIRCEEAVLLDVPDVHFSRGPFGKLHVRFGKAARTSGPRPRWVPMLDGMDLVAIQQMLGHWTVASTMRYVRPSETFIEDAYRQAVSAALGELTEGE
jgi:integrase